MLFEDDESVESVMEKAAEHMIDGRLVQCKKETRSFKQEIERED